MSSRKTNRGMIPALAFVLIWMLFGALIMPAQAQFKIPDPEPDLYLLDQANVVSATTRDMIVETSRQLATKTKAQVAVVTLKTLDDQPIEEVSLGILRAWGLGDKQLNNGVLILVVPSERKSRIEVGYGLEGALPDGKTGRIQDEYMLPAFQNGDYDQGLRDGYNAVVQEVAREYNVQLTGQTGSEQGPAPSARTLPTWAVVLIAIGLMVLFWLDYRFLNGFIFGMLLGMLFRGGFGGGRGGGSSGGGGSGGGGGSSRGW
jgi:uncharacterized protein